MIRIQTNRRNRDREEIISWCTEMFGSRREDVENYWTDTSNYDETRCNDFDMLFSDPNDAAIFLFAKGGVLIKEKL